MSNSVQIFTDGSKLNGAWDKVYIRSFWELVCLKCFKTTVMSLTWKKENFCYTACGGGPNCLHHNTLWQPSGHQSILFWGTELCDGIWMRKLDTTVNLSEEYATIGIRFWTSGHIVAGGIANSFKDRWAATDIGKMANKIWPNLYVECARIRLKFQLIGMHNAWVWDT